MSLKARHNATDGVSASTFKSHTLREKSPSHGNNSVLNGVPKIIDLTSYIKITVTWTLTNAEYSLKKASSFKFDFIRKGPSLFFSCENKFP